MEAAAHVESRGKYNAAPTFRKISLLYQLRKVDIRRAIFSGCYIYFKRAPNTKLFQPSFLLDSVLLKL